MQSTRVMPVGNPLKGIINRSLCRKITTYDRQITFSDHAVGEMSRKPTCSVGVQGKQQESGCWLVEAVYRVNPLTDKIPGHLQGVTGFAAVDGAAVHEQSGWFVYGQQIIVAVDNVQWDIMG